MEKEKHIHDASGSELTEKNHELILHNDDFNSFDYVIESLMEVCNHTEEQAYQCTLVAHYKGKCPVKSGSMEELSMMSSSLSQRGITSTID